MLQPRRKPLATYGRRSKPAAIRFSPSSSEDEKENVAIRTPRIALALDVPRAKPIEDTDDEEESRQIAEMLSTPPAARPAPTSKFKPRAVVKPSPLRPAIIRRRLKSPQPPVQAPVLDADSSVEEISAAEFFGPVASTSTVTTLGPALSPLLDFCGQTAPYDFDALVRKPPLELKHPVWRKLGEATYSEVFTVSSKSVKPADAVVAKIIPLRTRSAPSEYAKDAEEDELPEETDWTDALKELRTTKLLGDDPRTPGFVQLRRAFVVQGAYPEMLLAEWDAFKARRESLNVRPDVLPDDQHFLIICLPYQGVDIESVKLSSWTEAASIVLQVARSLAAAEDEHRFEHRDLHWGNVLVARVSEVDRVAANMARTGLSEAAAAWPTLLEPEAAGVRTTIIDFTLSRVETETGPLWNMIDECVFEGDGDAQFDVYRAMRDAVANGNDVADVDWSTYWPITNVQWIHYLVGKLLQDKHIPLPTVTPTQERSRRHAQPMRKPTSPADRMAFTRLVDAEDLLSQSIDLKKLRKMKRPNTTFFTTSRSFLNWLETENQM